MSRKRSAWASRVMAVVVVLALWGCDAKRIAELEVGVTTEQEVRQRWGEPAAVYDEPDGGHTLEYPRQPAGQVNYMLAIGADGKLLAMRQVLDRASFAQVAPGWDKARVRRLLGLPARMQRYSLKQEEVWDWRFDDAGVASQFSVTFDAAGRVTATGISADPKESQHG